MARNNRTPEIQDYRHDDATRRNNPPAGIASHGGLREKLQSTNTPTTPTCRPSSDSTKPEQPTNSPNSSKRRRTDFPTTKSKFSPTP